MRLTRIEQQRRDSKIILEARTGAEAKDLAEKYGLSIKRIYGIVPNGIFSGSTHPAPITKERKPRNLMRLLGMDYVERRLK